jgi:hypothetical protein
MTSGTFLRQMATVAQKARIIGGRATASRKGKPGKEKRKVAVHRSF